MFPTLPLGNIVLPTAPLTFLVGAWVALTVVEQTARRLIPGRAEKVYNLASIGLFSGIIGARVVFIGMHWSAYQNNLWGIIWPITSGFHVWAGLLTGVMVAFFYGRFHQLETTTTLDALAPGLFISLIAISLSDFLGGPGYGTLSNLPWAISVFGLLRHPVQIYEVIIGLAALCFWWHSSRQRLFTGQPFLTALALYTAGRLLVDAYRDNAPLTSNGFHIIQIISLTILLVAIFFLARHMPTNH